MSRSSYGYIAFKLPCPQGMPDNEVVALHEAVVKKMYDAIAEAGGELTTLANVAAAKASDADRIKEESIRDAANNGGKQ